MFSIYRYQLPFDEPFVTAAGSFNLRTGYLVSFESENLASLSEAAPLPGFSSESAGDVQEFLITHMKKLDQFFSSEFSKSDLRDFLGSLPEIPSVQFALSALGIDILIRSGRFTIFDLFGRQATTQIKVNAVTGIRESLSLLQEIENLYDLGYKTIKIKSAASPYNQIEQLALTLEKAANRFPDLIFRIDANQSWPASGLTERLESFTGMNVEYIEEPVRVESIEKYRDLILSSPLPVALDETISDPEKLSAALKTLPDSVMIIKPMLLGNIFRIHETISSQRGLLNDVVVTTTLESAVGRTMVASVASISGDPELAHGLDTGRLFEKDLHPGLQVTKGILNMYQPFHSLSVSELDLNLITKLS